MNKTAELWNWKQAEQEDGKGEQWKGNTFKMKGKNKELITSSIQNNVSTTELSIINQTI